MPAAAAVQERFDRLLRAAWEWLKSELEPGRRLTDVEVCARLQLTTTALQYKAGQRSWPIDAACVIASACGLFIDELDRFEVDS